MSWCPTDISGMTADISITVFMNTSYYSAVLQTELTLEYKKTHLLLHIMMFADVGNTADVMMLL